MCVHARARARAGGVCVGGGWLNPAHVLPPPSSASQVSATVLKKTAQSLQQEIAIWIGEAPLPATAPRRGVGQGGGLPAHLDRTSSWSCAPPPGLPNLGPQLGEDLRWSEDCMEAPPPPTVCPPQDREPQQGEEWPCRSHSNPTFRNILQTQLVHGKGQVRAALFVVEESRQGAKQELGHTVAAAGPSVRLQAGLHCAEEDPPDKGPRDKNSAGQCA